MAVLSVLKHSGLTKGLLLQPRYLLLLRAAICPIRGLGESGRTETKKGGAFRSASKKSLRVEKFDNWIDSSAGNQ